MNDWATAVSLIEHHPQLPTMQDAWVEGYRSVAPLSHEDEAELPTFVHAQSPLLRGVGRLAPHLGAGGG